MAVLTTLVGLLEMKHQQMEGEDGTGSLESDIQLMEVGCQLLWSHSRHALRFCLTCTYCTCCMQCVRC